VANSFLNKVSAERRVLSLVNARFRGKDQLAGLSEASINLWQRNVGGQVSKDIVEPLLALAEVCQCLSDRSHESFRPLNPAVEDRLESTIGALYAALLEVGP
jgi:hypothetical protein